MSQASGRKHPKGLYFLFFTEMWERFGFYLMLGIFSLYMIDSLDNGGMGFTKQNKSDIYGTYMGLVYLTPFIGGLLADRILGYRKSIVIGALLMASGYIGMAFPGETAFYISLLLIIVGNGFFKPNISTLVGNLYNNERHIAHKDAGYNIFYAGINIGAFFCNFVAAYMRINYGWGWAFAAAGVGMLIGLVIFLSGTKHIKEADIIKPVQEGDLPTSKIFTYVLLPVFLFGIIGWFIPGNFFGTDANDAFLFGCIPVLVFYASLYFRANKEDKNPVGALLAVMVCVIVFWAIFHQNGDALTIWAEEYTNREMPAGIDKAAAAVDLVQVVNYDETANYSAEQFKTYIDSLSKQKNDALAGGNKTAADSIGKIISVREKSHLYFHNLPASKRPEQGQDMKLISTELYQSINPFWVVLLTPVIIGLFGFLRTKKMEPSTPAKIALGLFITGLSTLVMVLAVMFNDVHTDKASSLWLVLSYGVITVGELCLSPMGLSLVSKLSPPRITSLMMGGWFLSTSVGNKLSGILSGLWEGFEDKTHFFYVNFALCMVATVLLVLLLKWLRAVMREKGIQ